MKTKGKCSYCSDPIYQFQEAITVYGKKYHKGCHEILMKEDKNV